MRLYCFTSFCTSLAVSLSSDESFFLSFFFFDNYVLRSNAPAFPHPQ